MVDSVSNDPDLFIPRSISQIDVFKLPRTANTSKEGGYEKNSNGTWQYRVYTHDDTDTIYHQAYVCDGYRESGREWSYYIRSLFQVHNETMNCWSHLIAFCLTAYQLYTIHAQESLIHNKWLWPLLAVGLSSLHLFFISTVAHLLHARSVHINCVCFMLDYSAIALFGLGTSVSHWAYSTEEEFHSHDILSGCFLPIAVVLSLISCSYGCQDKVESVLQRRKSCSNRYKILPITIFYLWSNLPLFYRFYSCRIHSDHCDVSLPIHTKQVISLFIGALLYGFHIPQRFLNASEIWFNSHALFHICVGITVASHISASYLDYVSQKEQLLMRSPPDFISTFGVLFFIALSHFFLIRRFYMHFSEKMHHPHKSN